MSSIKKRGLNVLFYFSTAFLLIFWLGCGPQEKNTNRLSKDIDLTSTRNPKNHRELLITIFPQDQEKVRNIEKPIRVYFSYPLKPENFSYKLWPEAGDLSVSWGMKNRSVSLNHSEPFKIGQSYHFEAEIRLKKEKIFSESVEFTVVGPSSLQRISKDQEKGLLDVDQAWTYRLQALFEPHLLPSEYQSPAPIRCGTPVIRGFMTKKDKLKSSTISEIRPYLVRPTHPESVFSHIIEKSSSKEPKQGFNPVPMAYAQEDRPADQTWKFEHTGDRKVKVWSYHSQDHAQSTAELIDSYNMYQKINNLMGRETVSDAGEKNEDGTPNNGGDGCLDIYLVPGKSLQMDAGICIPIKEAKITPSWIMINETLGGEELVATLAHEMFHAFQDAFDAWEDEWWSEATATWAEDFIAPIFDTEQENLPYAFFAPQNRMETITQVDGAHEYGIYLFPFYMVQEFGEKTIGRIWQGCESTDSLDAIDNNLEKGLDDSFKEFSLFNSDIGPHKGKYQDVGDPLKIYKKHGELEVELKSEDLLTSALQKEQGKVDINLPPLSTKYIRITNSVDKELTPHIRFELSDFINNPKITIQAIIEPDGKSISEDWSGLDQREFCVNNQDEDFEDMALIVASAERKSPVFPVLKIFVDAEGCLQGDAIVTIRKNHKWTLREKRSFEDGWEREYREKTAEAKVKAVYELERSIYYSWRSPPEIVEFYLLKDWRLISGNGSYSVKSAREERDEDYHRGIKEKHTYTEKLHGHVVVKDKDLDNAQYLTIVLDAESKKAKEVSNIGSFDLEVHYHGKFKHHYVRGDMDWHPKEGKHHASRSYSRTGERDRRMTFPVQSIKGDSGNGEKVTSGDGVTHLGGRGHRRSISQVPVTTSDIEVEWTVKRKEPQKKK